jgi:hypothetical protein
LKGDQWGFLPGPGAGIAGVTSVRATVFLIISAGGCAWRAALAIAATKFEAGGGGRRPASQEGGPENLAARSAVSSSMVSQRRSIRSGGRLRVEAWPVEVGQQRRQPREADEKFARARMVLGGHGVEPVQGGEDGVDVGHASFVRAGSGGQTYQIHCEAGLGADRRVPHGAGAVETGRGLIQKILRENSHPADLRTLVVPKSEGIGNRLWQNIVSAQEYA